LSVRVGSGLADAGPGADGEGAAEVRGVDGESEVEADVVGEADVVEEAAIGVADVDVDGVGSLWIRVAASASSARFQASRAVSVAAWATASSSSRAFTC
jgi:hypothetical protein